MAIIHQIDKKLRSLRKWQIVLKWLWLSLFVVSFTIAAYKFYQTFVEKDYFNAGLQFALGFLNFSFFLKFLKYQVAITYRFNVYNDNGSIASCTFIGENFESALLTAYKQGSDAVKYSSFDNLVLNILVMTERISYSGGSETILVRRKINGIKLFKTDNLQSSTH